MQKEDRMFRRRNYWVYSAGLAVVWAIVLKLVFTLRGAAVGRDFLLVFGGFCIGWVSTTIARFAYPPPKRWGTTHHL
jgi:hypothetical protein